MVLRPQLLNIEVFGTLVGEGFHGFKKSEDEKVREDTRLAKHIPVKALACQQCKCATKNPRGPRLNLMPPHICSSETETMRFVSRIYPCPMCSNLGCLYQEFELHAVSSGRYLVDGNLDPQGIVG